MSNVVDLRQDTFLRKLSEGTGIMEAGKDAGIEHDELVKMLKDNPKFALTTREIIIDHVEDRLRQEVMKIVDSIQATADEATKLIHNQLEEAVATIHGYQSNDE